MKYEFKGTPGPWSLGTENDFCADIQIGDTVASVNRAHQFADKYVISRDAMLANANLIAAALSLLSALIESVESEDMKATMQAEKGGGTYWYPNWYYRAKAAIEKALNIKTSQP